MLFRQYYPVNGVPKIVDLTKDNILQVKEDEGSSSEEEITGSPSGGSSKTKQTIKRANKRLED